MTMDHFPEVLLAEHLRGNSLRQADIDRFRAAGVPPMALVQNGIVLRHRIVLHHGGRFEFERYRGSDDAIWAFVVPAYDTYGDLADLVAFRPGSIAATWLGRIGLVGEEQVLEPRIAEPLVIRESIMDWLRAERRGCVIVDVNRAAPLLRDASPLTVTTVEHGQRLRKALSVPAPRILVQVSAAEARAA